MNELRWSEAGARCDIAVTRIEPQVWDAALAQFTDVSVEQSAAFTRLRWPSARQECLLFKRGETVIGGALVLLYRMPLGLFTIALSKWAPMRANASHPKDDDYRQMAELLKQQYSSHNTIFCVVPRLDPARPDAVADNLERIGFVRGANVRFPDRYVVDLAVSEDVHRKALGSKWRYHLKHSEKAGLVFEEGTREDLPKFDALYSEMSERKKFPDYAAYHTVPALWDFPDETLRPRLFFVRQNDKIIAGALVFVGGQTAVYMYGATRADALASRAGYFLQWNVLRWLRQHSKARWYDLGGSDGFSGLHQFKKGLVGSAGVICPIPPLFYRSESALLRFYGYVLFSLREKVLNLQKSVEILLRGLAKPDLTPRK